MFQATYYKTVLKGLALALFIMIGWLAPILFFNENADVRLMNLTEKGQWEIHTGDLAFNELGEPLLNGTDWRPMSVNRKEKPLPEPGYYWLKLQLHSQEWRDPHLFIHDLKHYELYWGEERLLESNFSSRNPWMLEYYEWSLVSLPFGYANDPLLFRIYSEDGAIKSGIVHAGNASDFIVRILHRDGDKILYSIIFASLFIVSALLFINTKRKLYFYFGLLAFCAGYSSLCRTFALGLFIDAPYLIYVHELMLPLGAFAFHGFFEQMFANVVSRTRLAIRYGMLLFTLLCLLVSFWDNGLFHTMIYFVFPFLFVFMVFSSLITLLKVYRGRKSTESTIMLFGYVSATATTLMSSFLLIYPDLRVYLAGHFPWLSPYVREDQLPIFGGMFMFLCCMGTIVLIRENEVHRQVHRYSRELEEKNKQLEVMDKLKDEFLANTSHELRTPLNGIVGITQSLLDGVAGPLNVLLRSNLSMVVSSGKRLSGLINDILDFAKLKHAGLTLNIQNVDVQRTTDLVVNVLHPLAVMKDIQLINGIDDHMPLAAADENRVQQILYNLVGNALKFTESGKVEITAYQVEGSLYVSVSDTGIGIAPDKLSAIFEPFEQGEGSAEREYEGAGLGLAITKKLVDLHGGAMSVRSVQGEGSVFTFTLPIAIEAEVQFDETEIAAGHPWMQSPDHSAWNEALVAVADYLEPSRSTEACLLLVDDDPVNLQVLTNFLSSEPCRIVKASNGMEAIRLLEQGLKPDLVLSDVMMPRMTGYDLCRHIRTLYPSSELPVILLTAKNQTSDLVAGFDSGANDYLIKPVEKRELLARIALHLELSGLTRNLESKVQERTKALEETNIQLQHSMRDTAEALAEASVLEERNRIAFDIHNTVGHSLTASIVQMEAAKMLIAHQKTELALPKLDTARELISKGLNDIRGTVRLLKQESTDEDLAASLQKLIRETEQMADVEVEFHIAALPVLSSIQKRALFHSLLEGLTNGIRHGNSTKFSFTLEQREQQLEFLLTNNGHKYEPAVFGFGLSAMQENIKRLGGTLTISANGREGSVLSIHMPLDWRAQSRFLETEASD
ncbi:ATP-binding protein [Cohnella silvisoli]|uniref:Oxygen sensor histidine kinase NreB n=1 Tax=Cohnella silvisoli TaxID=2873699 RepID=A0ABV1L044_9BACL|nr:ATP-binding protein [Cohnella silvisoli]MCD9024869.1 response regulator [Cohnella silvisoli]